MVSQKVRTKQSRTLEAKSPAKEWLYSFEKLFNFFEFIEKPPVPYFLATILAG